MGVVWECVDERLHRTVAVKQLLLQPGLDPGEAEEARQRAMREGRIAARLQHPHAISVYDVAEDNGQPVLVMEYLPSTSLAAMMSEHGPLPPREVARIGSQVAAALGAAHAAGVVHRDIKPGNILLGDNGTVKITDFGISRAQGDVTVTKTGMLAGTPAYLSPDVAMGQEPTGASDVFSLGATLYAAIEGRPPFGLNENTLALLHAVAAGRVEEPVQAGPMREPLQAMLQARVEDRPDMAQVREMLQAVADGQAVTSVPATPAPIPPAIQDSSSSAPDLAPTTVTGGHHDGTTVASSVPYDEDPYHDERDDRTAYVGAGGPGVDSGYYDEPPRKKSKRPVIVSGIALVALAVIAVLVGAAMMNSHQETPPANRPTSVAPQPLPPPPATSSTEETSSDDDEPTTTSKTTSKKPTSTTQPPPSTSERPTTTSKETSSSQKPTETSATQSGSVSTAQQPNN
jgi:serine/threonine protein kinase